MDYFWRYDMLKRICFEHTSAGKNSANPLNPPPTDDTINKRVCELTI
jgi:hypothetical protein